LGFGAFGGNKGGPKGRYVANLGHVQDDESGLIYMRARYYEPGSGRFISEDSAMNGNNWYLYCNSNPTNYVDTTGQAFTKLAFSLLISEMCLFLYSKFGAQDPATKAMVNCLEALGLAYGAFEMLVDVGADSDAKVGCAYVGLLIGGVGLFGTIALMQLTYFLLIKADPDEWSSLMDGW
jgi:RHS repeat-associated protein